jgi:type III secretion protein W
MREILPLKDQRFVDAAKIRRISDELTGGGIEQTIFFLRELHTIVRKLPLKIFGEDQDRLRLVEGVQDALDAAVDQEEEEFA